MIVKFRDACASLQLTAVAALCRFLDGISKEYLDGFEKIAALRSKVASEPKVKELYPEDAGFEP